MNLEVFSQSVTGTAHKEKLALRLN